MCKVSAHDMSRHVKKVNSMLLHGSGGSGSREIKVKVPHLFFLMRFYLSFSTWIGLGQILV